MIRSIIPCICTLAVGIIVLMLLRYMASLFLSVDGNHGESLDNFSLRDADMYSDKNVNFDSIYISSPKVKKNELSLSAPHDSGCLFSDVRANLTVYLMALQNSVRIISLPSSLSSDIRLKCQELGLPKRSISTHPHSIEMHFPRTLRAMADSFMKPTRKGANIGSRDEDGVKDGDRDDITNAVMRNDGFNFNPLWQPEINQRNDIVSGPLFYYIEALPYHVIYCTTKKNDKEDWTARDPYWKAVADFLLTTKRGKKNETLIFNPRSDFFQNMGLDFLIPASHPYSGPYKIHPASLSYLQRATFLKTDFDISGSESKDIILPYYTVDNDQPYSVEDSYWCQVAGSGSYVPVNRTVLLFFAGSDNPKNGYRSLFLQQLNAFQSHGSSARISDMSEMGDSGGGGGYRGYGGGGDSQLRGVTEKIQSGRYGGKSLDNEDIEEGEIYFSLSPQSLTASQYRGKLLTSKYCLILRGDTTSSKRLFSAISAGCVPIIISDGLRLPFSSIIDYSSFTLIYPESVVHTPGLLVQHVREVSEERYAAMRCALSEARKYAVFGHRYTQRGGIVMSSISPVTLVLVEALMKRESVCVAASQIALSASTMCQRVLYRLKIARKRVTSSDR